MFCRNLGWAILWLAALLLPGELVQARQVDPAQQNSKSKDATNDKQRRQRVLVTPKSLADQLGRPGVRLIELGQTKEQYAAAHIPGSAFVDWKTDITDQSKTDRFVLPPQQQIEKLLSRLGVGKQTTIVLSDNMSSRLSARMFWTLRCFGHQKIKILDGGRKAWVQSGRSFTKAESEFTPAEYQVSKEDRQRYKVLIDLEGVRAAREKASCVLIDGRMLDQFSGEAPGKVYHTGKEHRRKGHITGAVRVLWSDNFDDKGRFKSGLELKRLYDLAGATADKDTVTYCNEGLHAAPPWFVLTELLGYDGVKLYDDSMSEWANRDDTPMEMSTEKQ